MPKPKRSVPSKKARAEDMARREAKEAEQAKSAGRRRFLTTLRNGAIAFPVLGVGAVWAARSVMAHAAEADLSRIGQGTPSIVQVHDPQCGDCVVLQGQTRSILKGFNDGDVTYLVASLTTPEGQAFAGRYGVSRVTLVLFDAAGGMTRILRGPIERDALARALTAHIAVSG